MKDVFVLGSYVFVCKEKVEVKRKLEILYLFLGLGEEVKCERGERRVICERVKYICV